MWFVAPQISVLNCWLCQRHTRFWRADDAGSSRLRCHLRQIFASYLLVFGMSLTRVSVIKAHQSNVHVTDSIFTAHQGYQNHATSIEFRSVPLPCSGFVYISYSLRNSSNGINVIRCSVVRVPKRLKKYLWV